MIKKLIRDFVKRKKPSEDGVITKELVMENLILAHASYHEGKFNLAKS